MHYNIKNILVNHGFGCKDSYKNIYINLYDALKKAILNRTFNRGVKLPPSRVLAKDLAISRSTVLKAYDLLVLEKYVNSITGSGYFINSTKDKKFHTKLNTSIELGSYPKISKKGISFKKNVHIVSNANSKGIAFRPGLPPLDIFPVQLWKNLSNDYWKNVKSSELSYSNTIGLESLRNNISNYLKIYRNIQCDAEQIVVTTGSLHSLSIIGEALIDRKDEVLIENPTYPYAYSLFKSLKADICTTSIDDEGIVIENLKCRKPKLIYTTPSNQYPTGIKMGLKRRLELLKFAASKNTFIVEDDYDHEFSNWETPVSSIFSLDKQDRTIYLGTFNKLLHPAIRLGYMIVPYYLLDTIKALNRQSSRFVSPVTQSILSDFIEKDYLNKHLRHVIEASIERKRVFLKSFSDNFNEEILVDSRNTGLHIIANINNNISDVSLASYFSKKNVIVHPYSSYFINNNKQNGIVMGYSSVNTKVIKETLIRMKKEYDSFTGK
ncbi:PLP-dependent aminotransferase family protein [Hyunsoonleella aestuarii]|uniref:PLP-dependent aminotransferase family protein n=1 Tax=Hyunsoonleella aestuarii TaxID=912802 RepID=A0ABP8E9X0_9FLAO|nr:PLP-dependent aminotransferase family protein [Hyunsoonleella aestuarii]